MFGQTWNGEKEEILDKSLASKLKELNSKRKNSGVTGKRKSDEAKVSDFFFSECIFSLYFCAMKNKIFMINYINIG